MVQTSYLKNIWHQNVYPTTGCHGNQQRPNITENDLSNTKIDPSSQLKFIVWNVIYIYDCYPIEWVEVWTFYNVKLFPPM